MTKDELYKFYMAMIEKFPFVILEDPFNEDDYEITAAFTRESGIQIVGDDLFTTNLKRVAHGISLGAANTVLLKVNQVGTISEALEMIQYAYKHGYAVMPSDSRGEGEAIGDYAVGINAGSIRECGIGPRANRLLEIEEELGDGAKFIGAAGLKGFRNQERAKKLSRKE
jgi:enolase